jgi:hypothetical protein
LIDQATLPYSFLNMVFVSKKAYEKQEIEEELFIHEFAHIKQLHSIDILFIELLQLLFWFQPLLYLYKKYILINHEFLADQEVLKETVGIPAYQRLLLQKTSVQPHTSICNHFNYLVIKKRMIMMSKTTSKRKVTTLVSTSVLFFGLLIGLFGKPVSAQEKGGKNEYYQHATFIVKSKKHKEGKKKTYQALSRKEKANLPYPVQGNAGSNPLSSEDIVQLDKEGNIEVIPGEATSRILVHPTPPTPPAPPTPPSPPTAPVPDREAKTGNVPHTEELLRTEKRLQLEEERLLSLERRLQEEGKRMQEIKARHEVVLRKAELEREALEKKAIELEARHRMAEDKRRIAELKQLKELEQLEKLKELKELEELKKLEKIKRLKMQEKEKQSQSQKK